MPIICSDCKHIMYSHWVPTPHCEATRIDFVTNGITSFAPCRRVNKLGDCDLFEAKPVPKPKISLRQRLKCLFGNHLPVSAVSREGNHPQMRCSACDRLLLGHPDPPRPWKNPPPPPPALSFSDWPVNSKGELHDL